MITTGKFNLDHSVGETVRIIDNTNMTDAYWLRSYAGQAMSKMFDDNTAYSRDVTGGVKQCVVIAQALLAEVKKVEVGNE